MKEIQKSGWKTSFSLVFFSIALLLISVPLIELTTLFQTLGQFPYETALFVAELTRNIGIVFLFSASLLRYYGAVKPHKGARLASFECLMMSFDFFLLIFIARVFSDVVVVFGPLIVPLALFGLFFVYLTMGFLVEEKILRFYEEKKLTPKKSTEPFANILFSFVVFGMLFALGVGAILTLLNVLVTEFHLSVAYFSSEGVLSVLYIYRLKRKKII